MSGKKLLDQFDETDYLELEDIDIEAECKCDCKEEITEIKKAILESHTRVKKLEEFEKKHKEEHDHMFKFKFVLWVLVIGMVLGGLIFNKLSGHLAGLI